MNVITENDDVPLKIWTTGIEEEALNQASNKQKIDRCCKVLTNLFKLAKYDDLRVFTYTNFQCIAIYEVKAYDKDKIDGILLKCGFMKSGTAGKTLQNYYKDGVSICRDFSLLINSCCITITAE